MRSTVLIVEDEQIIALGLEQRLTQLGYHVVGRARTASRCFQLVKDLSPDIVLMDIRIDGPMNGIEAARKLRRIHDVPVLFMSGFADEATLEEAKDAESFGFLVKPFGDYEIRAAIEVAIQHHQMERQSREKLRFLAQAGAALSSSLDLVKTIGEAASLVVPRLATGCLVDILEPNGSLRSLSVIHAQAESQEFLRGARRLHLRELDPERGISRALANGRTDVLSRSTEPAAIARALGIADPGIVAAIGQGAIVCTPLQVGERAIGVLSLFGANVPSGEPDLELFEELTRRIAMAIDNARLYEEAQRAIRLREDLLAMASHDLRSPLNSILLSSEYLLKALQGPELHRAEVLRRSAERMRRMIENLLCAATLDAGRMVLKISCSPVAELVREALDMFEEVAAKKQIVLSFTPPLQQIELACDRERVIEVLANLLQNALKFTPAGGSISIRTQVSAEEVCLAVIDTGPGIQPEMLPFVFERYRQASDARGKGVGLGLYIVKGIVEAHHGRVSIESTPGVGTTVSLILPRLPIASPRDVGAAHRERQVEASVM